MSVRNGAASPRARMIGDVWGGLASMLVALPSAIAFGVLVFSAVDPSLAGRGAVYGMFGAAALGLVAPLIGGTPGLIFAPCAPAGAVLAGLAASLVAAGIEPLRIPGLLALTAATCAVVQFLFGAIRGGRFIKYIPYPVVSGFLSGVSVLILVGQLPKLLGLAPGTKLLKGLADPGLWQWPALIVGTLTMLVMVFAPRVTKKVPAAILALGTGIAAYLTLGTKMPSLMSVRDNPLVIGPLEMSGSFLDSVGAQIGAIQALQASDLQLVIYPAIALAALLSIDALKTCVMIDALTRGRHNSNQKLIGQGIGNFTAFLIGGMPGAGTTGPTLVNVSSGGSGRLSGLLEGVFVVLTIVLLAPLIAWVPIAALAGILLVLAFRMFDWAAFKLVRSAHTRLNFSVIAAVVITAQLGGLIVASAVGIGLAILLFIRDQIRGSVLRRSASLSEISSKTHRLQTARDVLEEHGEMGGVYDLQGNLFFGTTDQLLSRVEEDIAKRRWILMDMRRVQSLDYTAANLFRQMNSRLAEDGGRLLLCGMPSSLPMRQDIHRYLTDVGLVGPGESAIKIFETRNEGVEWMENHILAEVGWNAETEQRALALDELDLFGESDAATLQALEQCVSARAYKEGEKIFSQGDSGDEMYLIRRGSVRILLPLPGDKHHHLATIGQGDFLGEMAFIDKGTRSADAIARSDCELFILSRGDFDKQALSNANLATRVFASLAHALSLRFRQTDMELRVLEER